MRIDKDAYKNAVDEFMAKMKSSEDYNRFINLAGISRLSARNLSAVLHANRDAEEVGTLMYWNKRSRIIKPKEKYIRILVPSPDNPKELAWVKPWPSAWSRSWELFVRFRQTALKQHSVG